MMTTNLFEIFNNVLKGVHSLSIIAITEFTFYYVNNYFIKKKEKLQKNSPEGQKWSSKIQKIVMKSEKKNPENIKIQTKIDYICGHRKERRKHSNGRL